MHDDRIGRGALEMSRLQAVVNCILAHRRKERSILALALNSQNHHDVGAFDRVLKIFLDSQSAFDKFSKLVRNESSRSTDTDVRAQLREQVDIRTCDARVENVADDRDF